jgi:hypothetical protein
MSLSGRKSARNAEPKMANSETFQRLQKSAIFLRGIVNRLVFVGIIASREEL